MGGTGKITEEHSSFFAEYIDDDVAAVVSDIRHGLCKAFPRLTISILALNGHLVRKREVT